MTRWFLLLALVTACKGDPPNEERHLPNLHPPPKVSVPATLHIDVETHDGRSVIDAASLAAVQPDFADEQRVAWRLDRLIPPAAQPEMELVVESKAGVSVSFRNNDATRAPVLMLNRRGELLVQLVELANPFPGYHGAGGRLRRPPADMLPFVAEVTRIRVIRERSEN